MKSDLKLSLGEKKETTSTLSLNLNKGRANLIHVNGAEDDLFMEAHLTWTCRLRAHELMPCEHRVDPSTQTASAESEAESEERLRHDSDERQLLLKQVRRFQRSRLNRNRHKSHFSTHGGLSSSLKCIKAAETDCRSRLCTGAGHKSRTS